MNKKTDEQILDFINTVEEEEHLENICTESVKINNVLYKFKETEFFNKKFKIYIPEEFIDMPLEARKFKYPSENRPEIIKSNHDGSIAITFNVIDSPLNNDNVEDLKNQMKILIKRTNPANVFGDDEVINVNGKNIGYFEFKSSAIDDFLYNIMFFLEFEDKTLMGTFSCIYSEHQQWKIPILRAINTIEVIQ